MMDKSWRSDSTLGIVCCGLAATVVGGADVVAVVNGVVMAMLDTTGVAGVRVLLSRVDVDTGKFGIPKKPGPRRDRPVVTGVMLRVVVDAN